jgi:TetR/AcrR family transcriptional regulator, transcriptional repressor of bet genes
MPKQVDHEARRQRIADAVCRVAARQGLEGASLRHIAAEAGVSMGQVQHYFTSKDEMLLFAFHTLSARVERRLGATVQALGQPPSTRALLRAVLVAMVPTDDEGRFEAPLWVAFLARAVVEPVLAAPLRSDALVDFGAQQLRSAQEAGEVPRSLDPELEATSLFALADGLMIRTLLDPDQAARALAAIDYRLDRIFDGACSTHAAQAPDRP